jgi:hypothetical protein
MNIEHLGDSRWITYYRKRAPGGSTNRPELLKRVAELEVIHPESLVKCPTAVNVLLHKRHNYVRFVKRKGMEGFVVNSFVYGKAGMKGFDAVEESKRVVYGDVSLDKSRGARKRVSGINKMLKAIFYPDFDTRQHMMDARKDLTRKKARAKTLVAPTSASVKVSKEYRTRARKSVYGDSWNQIDMMVNDPRGVGTALGEQVHKQLEIHARMGIHGFRKVVDYPDPLAVSIIGKMMREWNVRPIWGELEIWDAQLGYATAVDMVCVNNENGRLVFFEVKTGYSNGVFTHASSTSQRKVNGRIGIDNTPLGHAFLQLILPIETMRRHYGISNIDGYVIHVNDSDCQVPKCYKLPSSAGAKGKTASYARIYDYAVRKKYQQQREKTLSKGKPPSTTYRGGGGKRPAPKATISSITSASTAKSSGRRKRRASTSRKRRGSGTIPKSRKRRS